MEIIIALNFVGNFCMSLESHFKPETLRAQIPAGPALVHCAVFRKLTINEQLINAWSSIAVGFIWESGTGAVGLALGWLCAQFVWNARSQVLCKPCHVLIASAKTASRNALHHSSVLHFAAPTCATWTLSSMKQTRYFCLKITTENFSHKASCWCWLLYCVLRCMFFWNCKIHWMGHLSLCYYNSTSFLGETRDCRGFLSSSRQEWGLIKSPNLKKHSILCF